MDEKNISLSKKDIEQLLEGLAEKHRQAIEQEVETKAQKFQDIASKQGESIAELKASLGSHGSVNFSLKNFLRQKNLKLDSITDGTARSVKIELNAAEVKTLVLRSAVEDSTLAQRVPGVGQLPTAKSVMRSLFSKGTVGANSNGILRYFDQQAITRSANTVAEGGTKPESAITWIEKMLKIEKLADSIPLSLESLADVDFIESEIKRLLTVNLELKEDQQLYSGDGNSPNLLGAYTLAPTFTAYSGPIVDLANFFDLCVVLAAQIANGKDRKYRVTHVLVNPVDATAFKLKKGDDGHYITPPNLGFSIVESSQVTANTMLIGDFSYGTIYDLMGVTITIGHINDQFIKNTVTMLAEKRLGLLVREVDQDAFLKVTDIATAIGLISTP